jgi:putative radical SAM enzyme (TIGR03279 family)
VSSCASSLSSADAAALAQGGPAAHIIHVEEDSPAFDAGFEPGCYLTAVDGHPLRDIIDWRWLSADDEIEVNYIDLEGDAGSVVLERDPGEDWGFSFEGALFDKVKLCRNACIFCFMRQLPTDARASLSLRDDDFRLSFLTGTFVTLTNIKPEDEARIREQHISPLRVSLHAINHDVRKRMIGKHAAHGVEVLEHLLEAGIQVHAQIVLMPHINDGEVLEETLAWAYDHPGILGVGIVPLGFTKHQSALQESFTTPQTAAEVLRVIEPFQNKARLERGNPWVFAADEFYVNAYGVDTPERILPAVDYGDFDMFEDGIGIVRSYVDEFAEVCESGQAEALAQCAREYNTHVYYVVGEAMQPFLDAMITRSPLQGVFSALTVPNDYFGGNVNVTGLLTAQDVVRAVVSVACQHESKRLLFVLPRVMFNHDGITLDDATVQDMEKEAGAALHVVSCNPLSYVDEIRELIQHG